MKLNLGSANTFLEEYINVDRTFPPSWVIPKKYQTQEVDLNVYPWPWDDSSVEHIIAHDIIEHLPDRIGTMNEIWRVLVPGGQAEIIVPDALMGAGFKTDPTLYAMLRVKNEAPWIARCLDSLQTLGIEKSNIFVLDDHSTDGTQDIAWKRSTLIPSPFWNGFDESRDKNYLLGCLLHAGSPSDDDWILCIDGDEAIAADSHDAIRQAIEYPKANAYSLKIAYLWGDEDHVRTDGWLEDFWRGSLWRVGAATEGFRTTPAPGNLHCSNIPGGFGIVERLPVRVLHYGYIHRADRLRKYRANKEQDHSNRERYEQLVIGDVFPADSQIGDCGPLQLKTWEELQPLA